MKRMYKRPTITTYILTMEDSISNASSELKPGEDPLDITSEYDEAATDERFFEW